MELIIEWLLLHSKLSRGAMKNVILWYILHTIILLAMTFVFMFIIIFELQWMASRLTVWGNTFFFYPKWYWNILNLNNYVIWIVTTHKLSMHKSMIYSSCWLVWTESHWTPRGGSNLLGDSHRRRRLWYWSTNTSMKIIVLFFTSYNYE